MDHKIFVDYTCKCGERAPVDKEHGHFVVRKYNKYICGMCGKTMEVTVSKVTNETKIEIIGKGNRDGTQV